MLSLEEPLERKAQEFIINLPKLFTLSSPILALFTRKRKYALENLSYVLLLSY